MPDSFLAIQISTMRVVRVLSERLIASCAKQKVRRLPLSTHGVCKCLGVSSSGPRRKTVTASF